MPVKIFNFNFDIINFQSLKKIAVQNFQVKIATPRLIILLKTFDLN